MDFNFDQFTFKIDRWHGEIDVSEHLSNITKLKVDMRGKPSGITTTQKQSIDTFIGNYEHLWKMISEKIQYLDQTNEYELNSIVTLAAPGIISSNDSIESFDYIVGYEAYKDKKYLKSFMACINNLKICEVVIAH